MGAFLEAPPDPLRKPALFTKIALYEFIINIRYFVLSPANAHFIKRVSLQQSAQMAAFIKNTSCKP